MSRRPPSRSLRHRIPAYMLDFIMIVGVVGYGIGWLSGGVTESGLWLNGIPALLAFVLIAGYFFVGNRYFRGTLWRHLLGQADQPPDRNGAGLTASHEHGTQISKRAPHRSLRRLIPAYFLDFLTACIGFGFGVAWLTGGATESGFSLRGPSFLLAFFLIIAYFPLSNYYLRGTLWRHIFGAAKPAAGSSVSS